MVIDFDSGHRSRLYWLEQKAEVDLTVTSGGGVVGACVVVVVVVVVVIVVVTVVVVVFAVVVVVAVLVVVLDVVIGVVGNNSEGPKKFDGGKFVFLFRSPTRLFIQGK